jgi:hypothetical protein
LAISAPHAVKSQFSSQTGVGGVKRRKIHSTLVIKEQYLCKNESSAEKKKHTTLKNLEIGRMTKKLRNS